jgi:hypothetical protein
MPTRRRPTRQQRDTVSSRAKFQCEYCRTPLTFSVVENFDVEHIQPIVAGGETVLESLALSCPGCNDAKGVFVEALDPVSGETCPLFHPRQDRWNDHFAWSDDGATLEGQTPTGRATVAALRLNRAGLINIRLALSTLRQHPMHENSS